jgi:glycosyltransferase involved in cell wall biosynthesis
VRPFRVVMVYIEPTPYIIALIDRLRLVEGGSIEAYYITTDLSQPWGLRLESGHERVLPRGFLARMQALRQALTRDRESTILHLAGWGHPVLLGALLMARSLEIPVAVESDTAEGRPDRSWRHFWRHWVKKLLYPLLFRLPSRFLPGGTRQARYLGQYGVKQERMTIAQMTVDVCAIRRFCSQDREAARSAARARWGMPANERIVLFVGRLEASKGLQELLSAFARAVAEENDLCLSIAGDGSLRAHVEAIATKPDCRVTYLGRLSGDDVLSAYLAADLLVLPSLFEPWGLVINEAMACGLPVIVSDRVGCADDLVRPGETGLVVGAGREIDLASAIRQLARDEPARRHMGQAAERLISNWTLGNEARNIVSAWHEIAR